MFGHLVTSILEGTQHSHQTYASQATARQLWTHALAVVCSAVGFEATTYEESMTSKLTDQCYNKRYG